MGKPKRSLELRGNADVDNRSDSTRKGKGSMPSYGAANASNTAGLWDLLNYNITGNPNIITGEAPSPNIAKGSGLKTFVQRMKDAYRYFRKNLSMPNEVSNTVYFHGSPNRNIERLMPDRAGGIFFTNDKHAARGYTGVAGTGKVYSAKLDLGDKAITVDADGNHIAVIPDHIISKAFNIPAKDIKKYVKPHHTFNAAFGRPEVSFYEGDDVFTLGNKLGASSVTIKNSRDSGKGIFGAFRDKYYDQTVVYSPDQVTLIPEMKNGGSIYIQPSKRGTFSAAARKHGMGVQQFANTVLKNKDRYSPAMVKKANFAHNASKWNK